MTLEAIREMLTRRPFEPLRITMSSGQVFEVRHPEMASLARSRMTVTIPDANGEPSDRVEASACIPRGWKTSKPRQLVTR